MKNKEIYVKGRWLHNVIHLAVLSTVATVSTTCTVITVVCNMAKCFLCVSYKSNRKSEFSSKCKRLIFILMKDSMFSVRCKDRQ